MYMQGYTARVPSSYANTARDAYLMADAMIEAKDAKEEEGIASVVKRTRKKNV
jgi:hypothetical protein